MLSHGLVYPISTIDSNNQVLLAHCCLVTHQIGLSTLPQKYSSITFFDEIQCGVEIKLFKLYKSKLGSTALILTQNYTVQRKSDKTSNAYCVCVH